MNAEQRNFTSCRFLGESVSPKTLNEIARHIAISTGETFDVGTYHSASGGCINDAMIIRSTSGRSYFVKSSSTMPKAIFHAEANGLNAIALTGVIQVPAVICFGSTLSEESFLVLECIEQGNRCHDYFETFGQQLAEMHRVATSDHFGFETNNWLGSSIQLNPWKNDWNRFWVEARLAPQLKMARDNGYSNRRLQQLGERMIDRIDNLLANDGEPPALIHGDLWSGNYLADRNGQPVIYDPACYYANREAEFGMTRLFGGFPSTFYDAYNEAWPLADGWESRTEIYTLYHLLNHLNLFGPSYLSGCVEILERYA